MQTTGVEILTVFAVGSLVMLFLAAAYIFVTVRSYQRIAAAEKSKYDEVFRSEKKYRSLFENSLAGIMTFHLGDFAIKNSNRAIKTIFACESQEELQRCFTEFPSHLLQETQSVLATGRSIDNREVRTVRKDGTELWVLFSARMETHDMLAHAIVLDITDRKHYEEKIKEQNALLDQTQDAILVIDSKGRIQYWNSGATLTFGWTADEVMGRSIEEFLYDELRKGDFHSSLEDIHQLGEWGGEQYHKKKDGKEILLDSHWKTIEGRGNGQSFIMIVGSDITEKRRLELQSTRSQKMESIAVLTGGLAHDLHNILAPLNMSIHVLRSRLKGESNASLIKAIEGPIHDGVELVKNILTYSKGIAGERIRVCIKDVLVPVIEKIERESGGNILVQKEIDLQKRPVLGDPTQLKQVFLNLCVNARDAMPQGGTLAVEAADLDSNERLLTRFPSAEQGLYVAVSVADTGNGIPAEDAERVFEPFFSTKGTEGTGLGLSVVQGIVTSHKGYVTVESTEGQGTKFTVYLPAILD